MRAILNVLSKEEKNKIDSTSVVRPTLLYIWRSLPKYAPPERSR